MEKKHKVIHEIDFTFIGEFFKGFERQGPGSEEATVSALQLASALNKNVHIVDIGCGTGGQTFLLAKHTKGTIEAIDLMPSFIESMRNKVNESPYINRISITEGSMFELPYRKEEFDLIWAEGSIYHIGYQKGLKEFRKYLKPGGMIAVSEASWFSEEQPEEIFRFWNDNYPEINTIGNKVKQMEKAGYKCVAHFILPEECWWNYFNPQIEKIKTFDKQYSDNEEALELISQIESEIELYRKYKEHYGYVFYIGQKI